MCTRYDIVAGVLIDLCQEAILQSGHCCHQVVRGVNCNLPN